MSALSCLKGHHGSRPPRQAVVQNHICQSCGTQSDFPRRLCAFCTSSCVATATNHPPVWKCQCGRTKDASHTCCEWCAQAWAPRHEGYGQVRPCPDVCAPSREKLAPYLTAHPRCPLPPPAPRNYSSVHRPPIVWRPQHISCDQQGDELDGIPVSTSDHVPHARFVSNHTRYAPNAKSMVA